MTAGDLAQRLGLEIYGDAAAPINDIGSETNGGEDHLGFLQRVASCEEVERHACGVLVVDSSVETSKTLLVSPHPKLDFARACSHLFPSLPPSAGVHPTAYVSYGAELSPSAAIGPYCVVESGARIGARTRLFAHVCVGEGACVGEDVVLHPFVCLYPRTVVGDRTVIHAGSVIGADGFGYVADEQGRHVKVPQRARVVIGEDVEIGAGVCIDRGMKDDTLVGEGTKIDNLVQLGHHVRIGRHCAIAAQVGLAGGARVGDRVLIGGQVGVSDHVEIAAQTQVGGQAGVVQSIQEAGRYWGTPAMPLSAYLRVVALLRRLPELFRRVERLEKGRLAARRGNSDD